MGKYKQSRKFEKKNKPDGTPNTKYVDVLEVDKPIAGQAYGCFSFISPEKILKQKEMFFFEEFLKQWEMNKSMEKFHQFLNFVSFKYKLQFEEVIKDFEQFVKEERELIVSSSVEDDYKTFLDREEDNLEKSFNAKHDFQTSVRAVKCRGVWPSQEEANLRAKLIRDADPNFDVLVGAVGQWLCWDPDAYKTGCVEHMEEELNQLVHEKQKNQAIAKEAFEQRVKETKQKAVEENKKNAEKHGNVVTQDIDSEGNLIGVSQEPSESISVADIRSELFDGENVVVGKTDYGQSLLKSGPFAKAE
jgi:hypothetical protein